MKRRVASSRVRVFTSEFNAVVDIFDTNTPPKEGDIIRVNDTNYTVIKRTWGLSPLFYNSYVDVLAHPGSMI